MRENVLIENDIGIIVGYLRNKWTVRFPLLFDEDGIMTLKDYPLSNIMQGIADYNEVFKSRSI